MGKFASVAFCVMVAMTFATARSADPLPTAPTPQQVKFDRRSPVVIAVERAKGAVVNISSTRLVKVRFGVLDDDVFSRLFGDSEMSSPFSRTVQATSLGSGVIIHPAGYVLTNAHVVARATEVTCSLAGKEGSATSQPALEARIISVDPAQDLAVLKIEAKDNQPLPFLPMGRSDDLMIGETVIAIGNAMGYSHTVTTGVVSAVGRKIKLTDALTLDHLIQTDASINPGNSGGPLLNVNGELIGINTAIRGDAQNIGFAIAIDQARHELAHLLDFARINELQFGATLDDRAGLKVSAVTADSPAAAAGLAVGDAVTAVDGKGCASLLEFDVLMLDSRAGQTQQISVMRNDKSPAAKLQIAVKLVAAPTPSGNDLLWKHFEMKVRPVDDATAKQLGLRKGVGLLITQMGEQSQAARLGLEAGDVLVAVDRVVVNSIDQLGQLLKKVEPGETVTMGVIRGHFQLFATLKAK